MLINTSHASEAMSFLMRDGNGFKPSSASNDSLLAVAYRDYARDLRTCSRCLNASEPTPPSASRRNDRRASGGVCGPQDLSDIANYMLERPTSPRRYPLARALFVCGCTKTSDVRGLRTPAKALPST
jgi:hypothetical protein